MLYEILSSIEHNRHYLTRYLKYIEYCKNQKITVGHKHHICPKAQDMFPEFASFAEFPWNCVIITPRQHLIAHRLLCKVYPNSVGCKLGLHILLRNHKDSIGLLKDTLVVRDNNNDCFRVHKADERYLSGELAFVTVGRVTVKNQKGETLSVTREQFSTNKQLVGVAKGTITVKDKKGKYLRVNCTDSRLKNEEFVGATKGYVTAKTKDGTYLQVAVSDERFESGELQHINKGKVAVRDAENNTFQVSVEDPRYLSGELVSASKGRKAPNLSLSDTIVIELRKKYYNKTEVFTQEFLTETIKPTDAPYINKKPMEELRLKNNRKASYEMLFAILYAKKYGMATSKFKNAMDGKSYKHIPI